MNKLLRRLVGNNLIARFLGTSMLGIANNSHLLPKTEEGQKKAMENFGLLFSGAVTQMQKGLEQITKTLPIQ